MQSMCGFFLFSTEIFFPPKNILTLLRKKNYGQMNNSFLKIYFFSFFSLFLLLIAFLYIFVYLELAPGDIVSVDHPVGVPLIMGLPAVMCALSLIAGRLFSGSGFAGGCKGTITALIVNMCFCLFMVAGIYFASLNLNRPEEAAIIKSTIVPLIILLIIGLCLITFTVKTLKNLSGEGTEKTKATTYFWIGFMYVTIFFSLTYILISSFICYLVTEDLEGIVEILFFQFIFFIPFSLLIACLSVCSSLSWGKIKPLAILIIVVCTILYFIVIFNFIVYISKTSSLVYARVDNLISDYSQEGIDLYTIDDEEQAGEPVSGEENYFTPVYLDFLWENASHENANDSIIKALNYAVTLYDEDPYTNIKNHTPPDEDTREYYDDNDSEAGAFNKIWKYLSANRDMVDYNRLFRTYLPFIKNAVNQDTYYEHHYDKTIKMLQSSYSDLITYEEEDVVDYTKMEEVYSIMSQGDKSYDEQYDLLKKYVSDSNLLLYIYDGKIDEPMVVWAYSFWGRRHHEDIVDKVSYILEEIREVYEDIDDF